MTYYCMGYRDDEGIAKDCPEESNSWNEMESGQCDNCFAREHDLDDEIVRLQAE